MIYTKEVENMCPVAKGAKHVQSRHADGFPSALIQSSLEEVRQVQVGQQRRTRLNPAPEAGHGLRNA